MKRLVVILLAAIFLAGCVPLNYNPSPEQREKNREEYKQFQRDKVQRDILKELERRK